MNKLDFQDAVEKAMDYFIGRPDAHVLIDDFDEDKETDEVIIFYRKWTGNKIKPKDRAAREEVGRFSDDICKIGILTAMSRAKSKINSFAYCVPVIEDIAEDAAVIDGKEEYLKHLEKFILSAKKGK
jgi:6-pyruvoyl-tetrahydropterin synthase